MEHHSATPREALMLTTGDTQRSAQLFTMLWHRRQSSLQFRHQRSVDPQTSQTSGSGSLGAVML